MSAAELAKQWRKDNGVKHGYVIVNPTTEEYQWRETLDASCIKELTQQDLFCSIKVMRYFAFDADNSAYTIEFDTDSREYFWQKYGSEDQNK
jgi:hypothetical protein